MASVIPPDINQNNAQDIKIQRMEDPRSFSVFDIRRIPCLRDTLLAAIGGGITIGALRKLVSRESSFPRVAFISYTCVALMFWPICRYNDAVKKRGIRKTMETRYQDRKLEQGTTNEYEQARKDEEDYVKSLKLTSIQDVDAIKKVT